MKLILHLLLVYAVGPVISEIDYDCSEPCVKRVDNQTQYLLFMKTDMLSRKDVVIDPNTSTNFHVFLARKYINKELEIRINGKRFNYTFDDVEFDHMFQIVKYGVYKDTIESTTTISIITGNRTVRWSIEFNPNNRFIQWSLYDLIRVPINMIHLHGSYWTNLFYDWIFFIVSFALSTFIISSHPSLSNIVPSLCMYATAAFTATFTSKLYHIILASFRIQTIYITYGILVNGVVFELVPLIFILLFLKNTNFPVILSLLLILIAIFGVVAGTSYYVGNIFISFVCIFQILIQFLKYIRNIRYIDCLQSLKNPQKK